MVPVMTGVVYRRAGLIGLIAALLMTACGDNQTSARLTPDDPVLSVNEELRIELVNDEPVRVSATRLRGARIPEEPEGYETVSAVYRVEADEPVRLIQAAPAGENVDVLRWDGETESWEFVPVTIAGTGEWAVETTGTVGLFAAGETLPSIGTGVNAETAGRIGKTAALSFVLLDGVRAKRDGSLDVGQLSAVVNGEGNYSRLPYVRISEADLEALLASEPARKTHIAGLRQLAADYDGAAVDYGSVSDEQAAELESLIEAVAEVLHEDGKQLVVWLPLPGQGAGSWQAGGYDPAQIGLTADRVIAPLPGGPDALRAGGIASDYLDWLLQRVDRRKVYPAFTAMSVDMWDGSATPIDYDYALAPLGTVGLKLNQPGARIEPGAALTFGLVGQASGFAQDIATGLYHYDVLAAGGEHQIWMMTAPALRLRLDWLADYAVGGVLIEEMLDPATSPGILAAVEGFAEDMDAGQTVPLEVAWEVRDADGRVLYETRTALDSPLSWTPDEAGDYRVSATIGGAQGSSGGETTVAVGAAAPPVAADPGGGEVGSASGHTFIVPEGMPAPVYPPGQAAFGKFELGGQVNQMLYHPQMMRDAGMTWVKFQLTWLPGQDPASAWELVSRGREAGFKVVLSIVGYEKRPQDIDVESFLEFLRGVAYSGPEAIEIWNEPNYYFEWPQGQMNGADYVSRMLAPAYNAIKEVNPNIMVISGAPLPTGAYYGEGGCSSQGYGCDDWLYIEQMAQAGASNYMDCVGVHYNAGATAPSASSGHPADPGYQHYSWYFGGMLQLYAGTFGQPVCFTELGYLSKDGYGELPGNFSWAQETSVNDQAAWLAEAAQLSRESGQVRLLVVWNVDFLYWGPDDPKAGYAIVRPDGQCPACAALGQVMP